MKTIDALPEEFIRHARLRGGVFTTTSARTHGVDGYDLKAAVGEGMCHRVVPGIYSLGPEPDTTSQIWAGLLHAGPEATLGGPAAAWIRGEGPEPGQIDIWTGHRNLTSKSNWVFHPGRSPQADDKHELDREFSLLATTRDLDSEAVIDRAGQLLKQADRERFLSLAEYEATEGMSVLESRFVNDVELRHGLPRSVREIFQPDEGSYLVARYPDQKVRMVFDAGIVGPERSRWDYEDHSVAYVDDDIAVHVTWWALTERACETAQKAAEVLWRNGWLGLFPECSRCNPYPFLPRRSPLYSHNSSVWGY